MLAAVALCLLADGYMGPRASGILRNCELVVSDDASGPQHFPGPTSRSAGRTPGVARAAVARSGPRRPARRGRWRGSPARNTSIRSAASARPACAPTSPTASTVGLLILAFGGDDLVIGTDGSDHIEGEAGDDTLRGGAGRDRIVAVHGKRDVLECGPGHDTALLDSRDRVRGCERVLRR